MQLLRRRLNDRSGKSHLELALVRRGFFVLIYRPRSGTAGASAPIVPAMRAREIDGEMVDFDFVASAPGTNPRAR